MIFDVSFRESKRRKFTRTSHRLESSKESQTWSTCVTKAAFALSALVSHLWTITAHKFSIGLRSGERDGHRTVRKLGCYWI